MNAPNYNNSKPLKELMPEHKIETRCPVCLTLDTSSSMMGEPINELKNGVETFIEEVLNDKEASRRIDLCIIKYGGSVEIVQEFQPIDQVNKEEILSKLTCQQDTPMGQALKLSLEEIGRWKDHLRKQGVNYYRPWHINITDGYPTDFSKNDVLYQELASFFKKWKEHKKLIPWAFGTSTADFDFLKGLYPDGHVYKLQGINFRNVFKWLSASISRITRSEPNAQAIIDSPEKFGGIVLQI